MYVVLASFSRRKLPLGITPRTNGRKFVQVTREVPPRAKCRSSRLPSLLQSLAEGVTQVLCVVFRKRMTMQWEIQDRGWDIWNNTTKVLRDIRRFADMFYMSVFPNVIWCDTFMFSSNVHTVYGVSPMIDVSKNHVNCESSFWRKYFFRSD